MDKEVVEQALAPLKPAFEADGARIEVGTIEKDTLTVNLFINQDTCRECLLPLPQIETLFRQALLDKGMSCDVRVIFVEESKA